LIERDEHSSFLSAPINYKGVRGATKTFLMHGVHVVIMGAKQVSGPLWEVLINFEPHEWSGRHVDHAFAGERSGVGQGGLNRFGS
jgi:hypothetical protein